MRTQPVTPRFAVYPGTVTSKTDGDVHFISFMQLCRLYRVHPSLCVDMSKNREVSKFAGRVPELMQLIPLRPSYHGDYSLPEGARELARP